mmetsp:Transcript_109768/g.190178  ORF Transcript_109768/g.190178 Transcript_109768/m.190178 type:complete len:371 (-) Transcript_109768:1172-2284(-)
MQKFSTLDKFTKVFEVIDPNNRTGKISVPHNQVENTIGKVKYVKNSQKPANKQRDFSLCLLFHSGECKLAAKCHQIHANADFVNSLRATSAKASTCCASHGDVRSQEPEYIALVGGRLFCRFEHSDGRLEPLRVNELARTSALEVALTDDTQSVTVPHSKVCRLHQEDRCRFGRDCKNYHLCRNVHERLDVVGINLKATPGSSKLDPVLPTSGLSATEVSQFSPRASGQPASNPCWTTISPPPSPPVVAPALFSWGHLSTVVLESLDHSDTNAHPKLSPHESVFDTPTKSSCPTVLPWGQTSAGRMDLSQSFKADSEGSNSPGPSSGSRSPLRKSSEVVGGEYFSQPEILSAVLAVEGFSAEFKEFLSVG